MNQLDVYYRALLEYKNAINENKDCLKFNNAFLSADADSDKLIVTRAICTVDEEWISEIEKGLVFIEKAIKEDRQFILSQGEVVPIEKVKSVSKESVQHLARHSDLITEYEEGNDIIPDKLYTVERLNDYTVYENRFLYMLLCYLRDFVSLRYNKIIEATNKYDAVLTLEKEFMIGKETLNYSISVHDVRQDDEYLKANNSATDIIDRMMLILKSILSFLATPLMEYQAKVPMIKPPITKTNVLKMNNNFKGAVALYDYIVSYNKDGYSIENQTTALSPFTQDMGEEFALAGGMLDFLMYEYGLGIKKDLKLSYEKEELQRKEAFLQRNKEQLEYLKRRLQRSEVSSEEYILKLEEQLKLLEKQNEYMTVIRGEVDQLKLSEQQLKQDIRSLTLRNTNSKESATDDNNALTNELTVMQREFSNKILKISKEFNEEKGSLVGTVNRLQSKMGKLVELNKLEQKKILNELDERNKQYDELAEELERIREEKRLAEARLKSYRYKNHEMTKEDDYTDKESFDELENELEVFIKFYKKEWKKAKRRIRKELLNIKNIRKQNEQD